MTGRRAIEVSEIERAADTILRVMEQMGEMSAKDVFILAAEWAINETDRRILFARFHEREESPEVMLGI